MEDVAEFVMNNGGENSYEIENISPQEFWNSVEKKRWLNAKEVANSGITKVEIISVGTPYKKTYKGRTRVNIDLEVKALDGAAIGETYYFTIGPMNAEILREKLGIDFSSWNGAKLKIKKERRGDFWFVLIEDIEK